MSFDYREAVDLKTITRFSVAELGDHLRHALAGGWRVLAFFGIPEEKIVTEQRDAGIAPTRPVPVVLCCVLAHDGTRRLMAHCTSPVSAFKSLTPDLPQMHYFEREIYEQWGVEPIDHPWLKSVRRIPDSAEAQARNTAAAAAAATENETAPATKGSTTEGPTASATTDTTAAPQPAAQPYPFYRVEGGEVHEVAVGPVHAGIIEPGHFRFQCYGENVLHLEIALGYQHRGLEDMLVHGPAARR
ncbi:MAG: NADH-quinone oxidoreductase subunit C, partial [Desulfovibrio sp.]|nr:NADH-quinone oxidoreductase subunit C [Desulfovibrio sp.]